MISWQRSAQAASTTMELNKKEMLCMSAFVTTLV